MTLRSRHPPTLKLPSSLSFDVTRWDVAGNFPVTTRVEITRGSLYGLERIYLCGVEVRPQLAAPAFIDYGAQAIPRDGATKV